MSELFPYQLEGASWLAQRRSGILADKMGLGKTVQAIRAADETGARRVAVVCPAIARINWAREFERWSVYSPDLKVASYNELADSKALRKEWAAWKPDVLIADEAHYLKDPTRRRTQALYGPYCRGDGLVRCAGAYWALSGTITPNSAIELYPHLKARYPEALPEDGSYASFLRRYVEFEPGAYGLRILGNRIANLPELRNIIGPILLRRTPEQVLPELPEVILGELVVDGGRALEAVREMERTPEVQELMRRLDENEPVPDSDPHLASFRKVCGLAKAGPIAELIADELESGSVEKIVLFAHHRDVIHNLHAALQKFGSVEVLGGQSDAVRQRAIDRFQGDPSCRVFVGQIQACSTAITLTAAHHCVLVESSWVPADDEQAIYRLRRILQKCKVQARMASLAGSIDELIQRTQARKVRALLQLYEDSDV